jgi:hypothetical protein
MTLIQRITQLDELLFMRTWLVGASRQRIALQAEQQPPIPAINKGLGRQTYFAAELHLPLLPRHLVIHSARHHKLRLASMHQWALA